MVITVTDNADDTGIAVVVSGSDPAALLTVQLMDTALSTWRDAATRVGDGVIYVASGKLPVNITTDRAYLVRVQSDLASVITYSDVKAIQATAGLYSPMFQMILQAKRNILQANLARVGGKVFHCIDPMGVTQVIGAAPAIVVFLANPEAVAPKDNLDTEYTIPVEVGVLESVDYDVISGLEWWLWVRWQIFKLFSREPVDVIQNQDVPTVGGRRWSPAFGLTGIQNPERKYEFRYQSIILNAQVELRIGE